MLPDWECSTHVERVRWGYKQRELLSFLYHTVWRLDMLINRPTPRICWFQMHGRLHHFPSSPQPAIASCFPECIDTRSAHEHMIYIRMYVCVYIYTCMYTYMYHSNRTIVSISPLATHEVAHTEPPQRSSRYDPASPAIIKIRKMGLWGKPGPPNSGSSPSASGK